LYDLSSEEESEDQRSISQQKIPKGSPSPKKRRIVRTEIEEEEEELSESCEEEEEEEEEKIEDNKVKIASLSVKTLRFLVRLHCQASEGEVKKMNKAQLVGTLRIVMESDYTEALSFNDFKLEVPDGWTRDDCSQTVNQERRLPLRNCGLKPISERKIKSNSFFALDMFKEYFTDEFCEELISDMMNKNQMQMENPPIKKKKKKQYENNTKVDYDEAMESKKTEQEEKKKRKREKKIIKQQHVELSNSDESDQSSEWESGILGLFSNY
jgi:hypothetical protein